MLRLFQMGGLLLFLPICQGIEFIRTNHVTTLADSGPQSLRQAILDTQGANGPIKIVSDVPGTISLFSTLPRITGDTWLDLPGVLLTGGTSNAGGYSTGVLVVATNANCRITGLTVSNVKVADVDPAAPLVNSGTLLLESCTFNNNRNETGFGGAILNHGDLNITSSHIITNFAGVRSGYRMNGFGGGIYSDGPALKMSDSEIRGNHVQDQISAGSETAGQAQSAFGGGLYIARGIASLSRVSIVSNSAAVNSSAHGSGGGIYIAGAQLSATNCTIARNLVQGSDTYSIFLGNGRTSTYSAQSCAGGGLAVSGGSASLIHCTIAENESRGGDQGQAPGYGGGIFGEVQLRSCVLSGNYAERGQDLYQAISLGENVISDPNGLLTPTPNDILSPRLPLLDSIVTSASGQWYYTLPEGSSARDISTVPLAQDQLLRPRPVGSLADAGSYEAEFRGPAIYTQPPETVTLTPDSSRVISVGASGTQTLLYELLLGARVVRSGTNSSFTLKDADAPGFYQVRVSNQAGSVLSRVIMVMFNATLSFVEQPRPQIVPLNGNAELSVAVTGRGPFSYQWFEDGVALAEATNSFLRLPAVQNEDLGDYTVQVSDGFAQIMSAPASVSLPPVIQVTNLSDSGPGSLREAIDQANSAPATPVTILLTNFGTLSLLSPLEVSGRITISNLANLSITGANASRFLEVATNASARLYNLHISECKVPPGDKGGAFWNAGELTLSGCTVSSCAASFGGAIFSLGSLHISNSSFYDNRAQGGDGEDGDGAGGGGAGMGGAIYLSGGIVCLTNVTFSANSAHGGNGGNFKAFFVAGKGGNSQTSSTIAIFGIGGSGGLLNYTLGFLGPEPNSLPGAQGGFGGGGGGGHSLHGFSSSFIYGYGSGSSGGFGGGSGLLTYQAQPSAGAGGAGMGGSIFIEGGTVTATHCTITSNYVTGGFGVTNGLGISGGVFSVSGEVLFQNCILGENSADLAPDVYGSWSSGGGNLFSSVQGAAIASDRVVPALELSALDRNSSLPTHTPLLASAAINAGIRLAEPFTDELGRPRWQGIAPDAGSIEAAGVPHFALTIETSGSGEIFLDRQQTFFSPGEKTILSAAPYPNHHFIRWTGDLASSDRDAVITMDRSKHVVASFSGVSIFVNKTSGGSVDISPKRPYYKKGEIVQLTPIPSDGWTFSGWSGDASGTFDPLGIQIDTNRTITANFSPFRPLATQFNVSRAGNVSVATFSPSGELYYIPSNQASSRLRKLRDDGTTENVATLLDLPSTPGQIAVAADSRIFAVSLTNLILFNTNGAVLWATPYSGRTDNVPPVSLQSGARIGGVRALVGRVLQADVYELISFSEDGAIQWREVLSPILANVAVGNVSLAGELGEGIFVTVTAPDFPFAHPPPYVNIKSTNVPIHFSTILGFDAAGSLTRVINLPPFFTPQRTIPLSDGFLCAGLYNTNATVSPSSANFCLGKITSQGAIDWIRLGASRFPAFDLTLDRAENCLYFAVTSSGFSFNDEYFPPSVGSRIFKMELSGRTISSFVLGADAPFLTFGAAGPIYVATSTGIFEYYDPNVDSTPPVLDEWLTANDLHLSWPAAHASTLQQRSSFGPDTAWMDYPVSPGIDGTNFWLRTPTSDRSQYFRLRR